MLWKKVKIEVSYLGAIVKSVAEWQKLLLCKQLVLNGADVLEENYKEVLIHNFKGGTPMCGMTSNQ